MARNLYIFEFRDWWPATDSRLPARWSRWRVYPMTVTHRTLREAIVQLRLFNQSGVCQQFRLVTYRRAPRPRYAA